MGMTPARYPRPLSTCARIGQAASKAAAIEGRNDPGDDHPTASARTHEHACPGCRF
jgi:hypothetical protein